MDASSSCLEEKDVPLVLTILVDCLEKLHILGKLAPSLRPDSPTNDSHGSYSLWECHDVFPEKIAKSLLQKDRYASALQNLHSGRNYLEESLQKILEELETTHTHSSLIQIIEKEKLQKLEDVQNELMIDSRKQKSKSLKQQVKEEKSLSTGDIQEAEANLLYLQKLVHKTKIHNRVSVKYSHEWEDTRLEQTKKTWDEDLRTVNIAIEDLKLKAEDERRIHTEIESFLNHDYQRMEVKLEFWIKKYNSEVEDMDGKIEDLRIKREKQSQVYEALVAKCETYKAVLKEDAEEKETERQRIAALELQLRCTLMIQSWWRAVMVRQFLGEFKYLKKLVKQRKKDKAKSKKKPKATGTKKNPK